MKKISRCLDIYEKTVGTIVLLIMLVLVTYQVFARFIFGSALRWSEELARYCMLYISFIGIGAGIKLHKHVGVEVLDSLKTLKKPADTLSPFLPWSFSSYLRTIQQWSPFGSVLPDSFLLRPVSPCGFHMRPFR